MESSLASAELVVEYENVLWLSVYLQREGGR